MNPTVIVGIVAAVLIAALSAGLYFVGERLLTKTEEIGDLKVKVKERDAIIAQKQADADLSGRLVNVEKILNDKFSAAVQPARETIIAIQSKDVCKDDPALAAAAAGVQRLREESAANDNRQTDTGRKPAAAVRSPAR